MVEVLHQRIGIKGTCFW